MNISIAFPEETWQSCSEFVVEYASSCALIISEPYKLLFVSLFFLTLYKLRTELLSLFDDSPDDVKTVGYNLFDSSFLFWLGILFIVAYLIVRVFAL